MLRLSPTLLLGFLLACSSAPSETTTTTTPMPPAEAANTAPADPWTTAQLLAPATLAARLADTKTQPAPVVFDIGPAGRIQGAVEIGPTQDDINLAGLAAKLSELPKTAEVVVYCGCCPFGDCPNIRPAMTLLATKGFEKRQLLNLPKNLKVDWIEPGYPMATAPN